MKTSEYLFCSYLVVSLSYIFYLTSQSVTGPRAISSPVFAKRQVNHANSTNIRIQSWNIRSGFLLKHYEPVNQTISTLKQNLPTSDTGNNFYWNWQENSWTIRRIPLAQYVEFYMPDIFSVQEALQFQMEDLNELLPDYDWIGVGRNNNKTLGEYESIFYNKNKVTLAKWDTFWLSDTPLEPSKVGCASSFRSATVGNFITIDGGVKFTVINTHWDDKCDTARETAASLIKFRAAYEYESFRGPVFLTGDFNSEAYGVSDGGYRIVTGIQPANAINSTFESLYKSSTSLTLEDVFLKVPETRRIGEFATFTGFTQLQDTSLYTRIDFHMAGVPEGSEQKWKIKRYHVPTMFSDTGFHISDHRSVLTDYEISSN